MIVFVIIHLVIKRSREGEELVLSSSHSLQHPFGAMPVRIMQWRREIGIFNAKLVTYPFKSEYQANACPPDLNKFYTICCMLLLHFICASDIERNPRKNNTSFDLSLCDWNFDSIAAHNFSNPFLLEAYNVQHKFDMICLSQKFLDTSIPTNDGRLNMKGYKVIRTNNPSDNKKGDVGIIYEQF